MGGRDFRELIEARWASGRFLCVGLDSEFGKIPESMWRSSEERGGEVDYINTVVAFNRAIVEATKDLVCAYKPNAAFYEAFGAEGVAALHRTIADIHAIAPDVPVILDFKRADIGNTNAGYVDAAFGFFQADAITVPPYLGGASLQPFLDRKDKGVFVLCRTSDPGSGEFQDLRIQTGLHDGIGIGSRGSRGIPTTDMPLHQYVAHRAANVWNVNGNCGLVVGATYPKELREVREIVDDMPLLVPGIGAQGGDAQEVVSAGMDRRGRGMIISASRSIIYASEGEDFASAARREAEKLHAAIAQRLQKGV